MGHHLRVDSSSGADRTAKRRTNEDTEMEVGGNDFNTTIFIGNLPFVTGEEEVRAHFAECGQIENVRIVRDPKTFLGKGIGYIMFTEKDACRSAVDNKNGSSFKGRELRVKKAVDPKRLEKKQRKKQEKLRKDRVGSEDEDMPENFEVESDDSEDEKPKARKGPTYVPDFSNLSRPSPGM
jgi:nucleolar protein 12